MIMISRSSSRSSWSYQQSCCAFDAWLNQTAVHWLQSCITKGLPNLLWGLAWVLILSYLFASAMHMNIMINVQVHDKNHWKRWSHTGTTAASPSRRDSNGIWTGSIKISCLICAFTINTPDQINVRWAPWHQLNTNHESWINVKANTNNSYTIHNQYHARDERYIFFIFASTSARLLPADMNESRNIRCKLSQASLDPVSSRGWALDHRYD